MSKFPPRNTISLYHSSLGALEQPRKLTLRPNSEVGPAVIAGLRPQTRLCSASAAAKRFTILTIGDGLVTAIPSLLISMAGGIITTRAASGSVPLPSTAPGT